MGHHTWPHTTSLSPFPFPCMYNIPYSCRKLSTVLCKVICLYYYSCYITTATIELPQQINSSTFYSMVQKHYSIYYKLL